MSTISKENIEFAKNLTMTMTSHLNMTNKGILNHSGEYKGVKFHRQIVTPKRKGGWGTGVAVYGFEGEKKEYSDINEFLDDFRKRILTITK